ncbi:hemicentin-2-like isoform X1 [Acropora millepora]|uniref:hemicentin-2-like isoform X1 n=1 Tax=Acropora millepora TaxID=45264 RepID=UPI001CF15625|nr:hemicentin-2-like isoform X1 [Acropora millepora]XP_044169848.1 hemicentin-2-like isoform X1 [Acropora millepora]
MVAEKTGPSFASILTIASIVMFTGGFVRIELEFKKQKDKIHHLESAVESMKTSNDDIAQVNTILRNRRSDYSINNKTENKRTPHETFTSGKLVSELRQKLCQSNTDRGCQGPPGPPGPPGPRGERGERGRRGNKGKTGNKGDNGIMGPPGTSGKQGIMGPPGSKGKTGLKGEKGETGTAGMKGAKGEPGESLGAPTVAVSPAKMTVNESKTASFQCSVSGNPKPVSTWSKLEGKSEKILSATTDGKLILPNADDSDSGVYKCSASNILGWRQALVRLVVNVHPRISLNPGPRHALQGRNFTLPVCHVTGYPTPVVTWKKSSGLLPQGRVKYNNSALQILRVRKEDSEFYICSAENLLGKVQKKTLLIVVSLSRFTSKPSSKIVSILNYTVRLNCSTIGYPQPTISWRKQGGQLPFGRSRQINGALVITNLQQSDAGNYICTATNISEFGDIETVSTLEIEKAALTSSSILGSLDKKYLIKLNSFLAPVLRSSSRSRFMRCWRAQTDGWAASTFHSNCDGKGPTVTVIQVGSYIFGGYTDVSWSSSSCGPASSSKSFIYSLYNINGFSPVKLQIKSGRQRYAIYRCSSKGPTFGYFGDISISNNAASNRNSYTFCGFAYHLPPGYSKGFDCRFYAARTNYFTPTDVEVFYETTT